MGTEKGKLKINAVRRGFEAKFIKENGKVMPLMDFRPQNLDDDGKECLVTFDNGKLRKIVLVQTGKVIFPEGSEGDGAGDDIPEPESSYPDAFSPANAQWPKNTSAALAGFRAVDNFYLKFYKAARLEMEDGKPKFQPIKTDRGAVLYGLKALFDPKMIAQIAARASRKVAALGYSTQNSSLVTLESKSDWRWVTGLGNASVYENGMTLHHVYGIPYLPGSGVKGMLRTWIIQQCFDRNEESACGNAVFQTIFGYPDPLDDEGGRRGEAIFFDAFPMDAPTLAPDVMNNHYQDYYDGHTPPADWLNPNPIFFMTLTDSRLRFQVGIPVGSREVGEEAGPFFADRLPRLNAHSTYAQLIQAWMTDALQYHGVGAKTAVGYGRMSTLLPGS